MLEKEKHMCFEKSYLRLFCVTEFIQEAPFKTWTPLTMEAGVILKLFLMQHEMVPAYKACSAEPPERSVMFGHFVLQPASTRSRDFTWVVRV